MIIEPTALVLGAGASMDYGFPSGLELMKIIMNGIVQNFYSVIPKKLADSFNIEQDEINNFYKSLSGAGKLSVDAFLEHRHEFLTIGKLAIINILTKYEKEDRLINPRIKGKTWYEYLWNKLDAPFDDFDKNKLSIITFNYDRSLEHYLITAMKNLYGKPEEQCAQKLNTIPIIHVHGKLGNLPWQGGKSRPYTPRVLHMKEIIDQIIVIPEQEGTSPEFKEAINLLRSAKYVYFLGFGYHNKNLARLRMNKIGKESRGTALDLGEEERNSLRRNWNIRTFDNVSKNLDFLKNYAIFNSV
jgi:hypothetical protein